MPGRRRVLCLVSTLALTSAAFGTSTDDRPAKDYKSESLQGRVVWLSEAMRRRFGVNWTSTTAKNVLALETSEGRLYPLVEDVRGRSFRKDQRLREMDVELLVRHYESPDVLQVVRILELRDGKKSVVDYWCDVCAIVMFEDGPCDCCQDHNRLRKRPVK